MSRPSDADTNQWCEDLIALGFSDDGERLQGPVTWQHRTSGAVTARVEVVPDEPFPFAPPRVGILNTGAPLELTFHINHDGSLCLWDTDWAVDEAPWRSPQALLTRIAGWIETTEAGWPDDDVCDLERYLDQDPDTLVLYDTRALVLDRAVRTKAGPTASTLIVSAEPLRIGDIRDGSKLRRKDKRLAWVADIGPVERPFRTWTDVVSALGDRAGQVDQLISFGVVNLLLLRYSRGHTKSALALKVGRTRKGIAVIACESADTSTATRNMRAGPAAPELAEVRVAVVGCGAIGSFAADLLFRAGVRSLTLRDSERLRPGNVVRHLAGTEHVGVTKTQAVRNCLARIDPDIDRVKCQAQALVGLDDAMALIRDHHVVLDATGNARASSLLAAAAEAIGPGLGHTVVSACTQRDGDVVRVDRLPLRTGEQFLPALALLDDASHPREQGCGSPVSPTPPGAVIAAAELAHRVVIDEATRECSMPATIVDVRVTQPEPPYDRVGRVTSNEVAPGGRR